MRTAAEYREMAKKIGAPRIHADPNGFAHVDAAFLESVAAALREAAEMREAFAVLDAAAVAAWNRRAEPRELSGPTRKQVLDDRALTKQIVGRDGNAIFLKERKS